jgi:hypothetical protein
MTQRAIEAYDARSGWGAICVLAFCFGFGSALALAQNGSVAPTSALTLSLEPGAVVGGVPRMPSSAPVGTYEFWAEYQPPFLSTSDQAALQLRGMDYPHEVLRSPHFILKNRSAFQKQAAR